MGPERRARAVGTSGGGVAMTRNIALLLLLGLALAACGGDDPVKSVEELRDPATCMECHAQHYQQWSGSMHAYASDDPVFVAMNKRGQRETNGALGDFCVKCHAPMAVQLGLTDGTSFDPAALPAEARGITCYFCHNVDRVAEDHNNGLVLANDQTMRGGALSPVNSPAHHSKYDKLMDSDQNESEMCGSCHDIVVPEHVNGVPGGVAVERTFAEWKQTFFATDPSPQTHFTCGACHMVSKRDLIADAPGLDVAPRPDGFHSHTFPGIDQALSPFVETDAQTAAIKEILDPSVRVVGPLKTISNPPTQPGGICLEPDGLHIRIDNLGAAHSWPSGAGHDRRAWLEVKAFDVNGTVVFSSGVTPANTDPVDTPGTMNVATFGMWDRTFKADNSPAHFFWEIAREEPQVLKFPAVLGEDHSTTVDFNVPNPGAIDRIETRLFIRPLPYEVLADLVSSGDLAAGVADNLQTLEVGGTVGVGGTSVWTRATKGTGAAINTGCNPK